MEPIEITAVTDGRPGHRKQTEAVLGALAELTPVNIRYRSVGCDLKSDIRQWIAALGAITGPGKKEAGGPDIVFGTGSHTHADVLRLGTLYNAKKIICMSPPPGLSRFFDLCFIPEHDGVAPKNNFFFTVGPPNLSKDTDRHEEDRGLILVGGTDPKSHHWHSARVLEAVKAIISRASAIRWTLSTSPRTPTEMEQALKTALPASSVEVVPFSRTPKGWIEEQYAASRFVWVTADSMSMVYEAMSAGCRVGLIPVEWKRNNKFAKSEKHLVDRGYAVSFKQWLESGLFPDRMNELNEAARCAAEILERWWPERLP